MSESRSVERLAPTSSLLPEGYFDPSIRSLLSSDGQVYVVSKNGTELRIESWEVARHVDDTGGGPAADTPVPGSVVSSDTDRELQRELEVQQARTYPSIGSAAAARSSKKQKKQTRRERREQSRAADALFESVQMSREALSLSTSGPWRAHVVRHLRRERLVCPDCGHQTERESFDWVEVRCPFCWSRRVDRHLLLTEAGTPEVPFGNVGEPYADWRNARETALLHGHVWGVEPAADASLLHVLSGAYKMAPDGHPHLFLLCLFGRSLIDRRSYQRRDLLDLGHCVGGIALDYFRLTGLPQAARMTLDLLERAIEHGPRDVSTVFARKTLGIAIVDILTTFEESRAEINTGRAGLRARGLAELRLALEVLDRDPEREVPEISRQRQLINYHIATLLLLGHPSLEERNESIERYGSVASSPANDALGFYARGAEADAWLADARELLPDDAALNRGLDGVGRVIEQLRAPTPLKFKYRWRWALRAGQFLLQTGDRDLSRDLLESAVTFVLKDTSFAIDPLVVTADSERYHQAFSVLARLYAEFGWWFESLSLLETYRGRVIELAAESDSERHVRRAVADERRRQDFYQMTISDSATAIFAAEKTSEDLAGRPLGPFTEDYELEGLSDRILELFDQLSNEPTVLVSLSFDDATLVDDIVVSAIIIGPPVDPPRQARCRTWTVPRTQFDQLRSDLYRRPSSFREPRLQALTSLLYAAIVAPMADDLHSFACLRAFVVAPSVLSNVPLEITSAHDGPDFVETPFARTAFTPSLMFGQGRHAPGPRRRKEARLLIIGYRGSVLRHADEEAAAVSGLYGDRALYLAAESCDKRRVVEELNGDYDVIHFICHGTYDIDRPRESALYFTDDRISDRLCLRAQEIRDFVRLPDRPVVTLSACSTSLTADSRTNTWHGLPGSFLEAGARCVIGTRWPVADRFATDFMSVFYRLLAETELSPLECFHSTQQTMRKNHSMEDWACFGYLGLP
jgi:CHAT domain-containing protein